MRKFLAIIAISILPAAALAQIPNPFHPYKPLKQIDWKANWQLGKDSLHLSFRPYSLMERSLVPVALSAACIADNDYVLEKRIKKLGSISSPALKAANVTQYSPAAIMYVMKLCGVEGRSDWPRMITADIFSELLQAGMVNVLKYTVKRDRPDGRARNSFPSGHTATAFMCATLLHKEYGETVSPWISVAGYGFAVSTGIFRVEANRHFCSDVLAGAAIGILSAELAYDMTDALFGERGLKKKIQSPDVSDRTTWNFSLVSDYSVKSDVFTGNDAKPAYSIGVKAAYQPWYLGAAVYAGATQLQWTGSQDVYLEDGAGVPDIITVGAGVTMDIPLMKRVDITGDALFGSTVKDLSYRFISDSGPVVWDISAGQRIKADLGVSIRTTGYSGVSLTAGYDRYEGVWEAFTLGTSFNFVF